MAQHRAQLCVHVRVRDNDRCCCAHTLWPWIADTRLVIFIGLALLFGLLFFQLDWESDLAGVNSLNACVLLSSALPACPSRLT